MFNRALKCANLAENEIGDEGAIAICAALESNTSLTRLDLRGRVSGTMIGTAGAQAIAKMLVVNRSLNSVDLTWNDIPDKGKQLLRGAVGDRNITLQL